MATTDLQKPASDHLEIEVKDEFQAEFDWTEADETKVRRKIDRHILPLVTILYLMCFLDRSNIGNARIEGLSKDLNLVGYRFNIALTVFFISYLLVEVPSNVLLTKVGPRFYIPSLVGGFGLVSLCTAFVQNFAQLCVARFFLGIFEGGTTPGIAFYLSTFYKRRELYFRIGFFVSAVSLAGAFGGLFATALSRIPRWGTESTPIHTWRNIFFFEGILTILIATIAPFLMPSSPTTCTFLSERERAIANERLLREYRTDPHERLRWQHIKAGILNINTNIAAVGSFFISITVQGVAIFLPTILKDLGWTATRAQLYSVPPYVAACLGAITVAYFSDKVRRRGVFLACATLLPITGFCILIWITNASIRYMAIWLITIGAFPGAPGYMSWAINNTPSPPVRAVVSAYCISISTLGGLLATWTYLARDAPRYPIGQSINLAAQLMAFCIACFGIFYNWRENRLRQNGKRSHRLVGLTPAQKSGLGHRDPEFRYIL